MRSFFSRALLHLTQAIRLGFMISSRLLGTLLVYLYGPSAGACPEGMAGEARVVLKCAGQRRHACTGYLSRILACIWSSCSFAFRVERASAFDSITD